jgi:adenylate cyclase
MQLLPTSRWVKALALGTGVGLLGVVAWTYAPLQQISENADLSWLFALRGPRPAPPEVVVVSIDKQAARALNLPVEPHKWPRSLHAQLLDNLRAAGTKVIGLDILFKEAQRLEHDDALARAIGRAGNVVLFEYLDVQPLAEAPLNVERVLRPRAQFADVALTTAIFPLPKFPKRVNQFWTFKAGAGDVPTLPVVMAQAYQPEAYDALGETLHAAAAEAADGLPVSAREWSRSRALRSAMQRLRATLRADRELVRRFRADARVPAALLDLYTGPESLYLNFYGPARTITTVPYHVALQADARPLFRDKMVLVGLSEPIQTDQMDTFNTVYSRADGIDLSGVEIGATAVANLLHHDWVRPVSAGAGVTLILLWGIALTLVCRMLTTSAAIAAVLAASAIFLGLGDALFTLANVWIPLLVPLLVQAPVALFGVTLWRYRDESREKHKVRAALEHYLPAPVVDQIADDIAHQRQTQHLVYGVCLATDAEHYTALSERMSPQVLGQYINRYYAALFPPVRRHGGIVSDVVGDAMMALWASLDASDPRQRKAACLAAIEMLRAVEEFNRAQPLPLPTRIGLHAGEMVLGNVGAEDHYEYRAVGDMVNTAARIQGLNKRLGTRVLVSADVLRDVDGLCTRELGRFLLAGKSQPVTLYELLNSAAAANENDAHRCELFAAARARFEARDWSDAAARFDALTARFDDDGPARFFRELCARYAAQPPLPDWDGAIHVATK